MDFNVLVIESTDFSHRVFRLVTEFLDFLGVLTIFWVGGIMLIDTIRAVCIRAGKEVKDLISKLETSKAAFYKWVRSPDWESHELTLRVNFLIKVDLVQLEASGGIAYDGTDLRQNASNHRERRRYPEHSFGYVLYDYLVKSKRSIRQLAQEVNEYPSHLVFVAKGQATLHLKTYEALCQVDSSFIRHRPWAKRPYSAMNDAYLRQFVAKGIFTQEEIDSKWRSFKDGEYRTRFINAYIQDLSRVST